MLRTEALSQVMESNLPEEVKQHIQNHLLSSDEDFVFNHEESDFRDAVKSVEGLDFDNIPHQFKDQCIAAKPDKCDEDGITMCPSELLEVVLSSKISSDVRFFVLMRGMGI
jgi:hypothetical protein